MMIWKKSYSLQLKIEIAVSRMKSTHNKRILVLSAVLLLCFSFRATAQYNPPDGTENISKFLSPSFLSGNASVTSRESPQADGVNPAASAGSQLIIFDASYIALVGFSDSEGWNGHIVNVGSTFPTAAGNFSWSGHFFTSSLTGVDLGTFGAVKLSFAKELYPGFLTGVGVNFSGGSKETADWSLTADIGVLLYPPTSRFSNFRWAFVLKDFGKSYNPSSDGTGYPSPFTPVAGIGFSLISTPGLDLSISADVGFPSFQNIRANIGAALLIRDSLGLQISSTYDFRELIGSEPLGSFIPSFGLSFVFRPEKQDSGIGSVKTQLSAAPLKNDIWAFGAGVNVPIGEEDVSPPKISIKYDEISHFSPNHDGIMDDLVLDIEIQEERYIKGYEFNIWDVDNNVIRTIRNKENQLIAESEPGILDRIAYIEMGIAVPEKIRWDGTNDGGAVVSDGVYSFSLKAWDDNGNMNETGPMTVVVDSTAPALKIETITDLNKIFSPNDDGKKDTIMIGQSGSAEELWIAQIWSNEKSILTTQWRKASPTFFEWDGKDDAGILQPDGVYSYSITSADRAGNQTYGEVQNIIINTESTPITVEIDLPEFSPNGDDIRDALIFSIKVPVKNGVDFWELSIKDSRDQTMKKFKGGASIPSFLIFDGRDERGTVLEEGIYKGILTVTYLNGNAPNETSPSFIIDLTPPEASIAADQTVFSPNGDGNKDTIAFFQETSEEELWHGEITSQDGRQVISYEWRNVADNRTTWDGQGKDGLVSRAGLYYYRLYSTDRAGNKGVSNDVIFELNTEETPVLISREFDAVSPNADGKKDFQNFFPQVEVAEGVESFTLKIFSSTGTQVRTFSGRQKVEASYKWDGLTETGSRAPDGEYYGRIEIIYENGNKPSAISRPFTIDTVYPSISVILDNALFSPNGDGNLDTLTIRNSSSEEDLWEARIVSSEGEQIRQIWWNKSRATSYVWDGTDEAGNKVQDGDYYYEIFATDQAGNSSIARSVQIRIDTSATKIFVTADRDRFSPNGDGKYEEIAFNTLLNVREGVQSWTLDIKSTNGITAQSYSGASRVPEKIIWDGRSRNGVITEGEYFAVYMVTYKKGDRPEARTSSFIIDNSPPSAVIRVSPQPFSPDGDGTADELVMSFDVEDQSEVSAWSLSIYDPNGKLFKDFSGEGMPSNRIVWEGRSNSGELVLGGADYSFVMSVEDSLSNKAEYEGKIPVDVLVLKEDDSLILQITSLNFTEGKGSLDFTQPENSEKNRWLLARLAEILNEYSRYQIRIEGYSSSSYWANPERLQKEQDEVLIPLSQARADVVKQELIKRGVDSDRLNSVGLGGAEPAVPHSDLENRWKNNRIQLVLLK